MNRVEICKSYIINYFIPDLLSIFSLFVDGKSLITNFRVVFALKFMIFFRIYSINQLIERIQISLRLHRFLLVWMKLFQLMFFILKIAHFCSCAYHVNFFLFFIFFIKFKKKKNKKSLLP
jgi:hypothetical protein